MEGSGSWDSALVLPHSNIIAHQGLVSGQEQEKDEIHSPFLAPAVNMMSGYKERDITCIHLLIP